MKAIAYLLAWVALLPALVSALDPAPPSTLPAGWRYKGCYTDLQWNANNASETSPVYGVVTQPRALNGYFNRISPNGGNLCITACVNLAKGYTVAATNDNQCWCDTSFAKNGTSTAVPGYGILDSASTSCQQGCRGRTSAEACGSGGATTSTQRLSVYEIADSGSSVSGFHNNACVLKLKLLYFLFLFCCGSVRHDDDDDETRTSSDEGHTMLEHGSDGGGGREDSRCGRRTRAIGCRSQGLVAVGIMKLNIATLLAYHTQLLMEVHRGSARLQLHNQSLHTPTHVHQANCPRLTMTAHN